MTGAGKSFHVEKHRLLETRDRRMRQDHFSLLVFSFDGSPLIMVKRISSKTA